MILHGITILDFTGPAILFNLNKQTIKAKAIGLEDETSLCQPDGTILRAGW